MTSDPVRAQFEAWAKENGYSLYRHNGAAYSSFLTQNVWAAWKAALAAQERGGERVTERWEPMETAPMDGTVIQFLQGGEVFAGFAGDDPDHPWQFLDRNGRQAFVNGFHHKFSPRWWRPLAEAPKEAALRAAQEGGGERVTDDPVIPDMPAYLAEGGDVMVGWDSGYMNGWCDCLKALRAAQEGTSNG